MWLGDLRLIEDEEIHKITPEIVAEMFCALDSHLQARFFNHIAVVASKWSHGGLPMQLQYITDDSGLNLAGRRVMQGIGEYSHWGLCNWEKYKNGN